ncbi:MAG: hypothetical protein VYA61_08615 [Pseudomonadota bacterium]|nr:hypothetical protein [Pseudomonadota bacterium]|tara:strand:+ start:199 stop:522 length:324 start_codon:yes stop_codon:yes gene_type:complete
MYLIDQAKLEPYKGSGTLNRLNLGDWLGIETDNDGRISVWADVNSSFFGLKRSVREHLGFLPKEASKMLSNSIKNGRRVRARLVDMQRHFHEEAKNKATLSVSLWSD